MSLAAPATPFPFIHASAKRRKNIWYSIGSGNWTDPNIWMCNALTPTSNLPNQYPGQGSPTYVFPRVGDDVYIGFGHTVTFDTVANSTTIINNLYVAGTFKATTGAKNLNILGDLQATGTIDFTGSPIFVGLYGVNNYINTFVTGSATIVYTRNGDQPVMSLVYGSLVLQGAGIKYLTSDLSIPGSLSIQGVSAGGTLLSGGQTGSPTFELGNYNLTVGSTTALQGQVAVGTTGIISKTGAGSVLFVGNVTVNTSGGISFTGNPTVEFRGGFTWSANTISAFNTGTNTWSATTNAQTFTVNSVTLQFTCPISVVGAIAVSEAGSGIMSLNQPIDCTSSSGSVVAKGTIYFNSAASLPSFTTGTFDRTSFANTVGYTMPASITLPYTNYWSLLISNSGTKVPSGNTTLSGNLVIDNVGGTSGNFDLTTFNLTVTGTTTPNNGSLRKTGTGNVLFIGAVTPRLNSTSNAIIDFRTGNPNVELRGGIATDFTANTFFSGTGAWTFTTNNQTIGGFGQVWDAPIIVSGGITVTLGQQTNSGAMSVPSINGTTSTSKFVVGTNSILYFTTNTIQMPTGIFDHSTNVHTLGWVFDGDYTLPYTTFTGGLTIGGTGAKTVTADLTIPGNLLVQATNGYLEMGTFNLSVGGTTNINHLGTYNNTAGGISKSGTGSILFIGQLILQGGNPSLYLTGNPSVELRGGINFSIQATLYTFSGSSTFTFTTNNQSISSSFSAYNFPYNILISGAITLTNATANNGLRLTGTINGNNAASTFDNRGRIEYQNAQQPMLTGVLQTNLAANTFVYNAAGNQDVTGGTYRTLQLAGSGVKTLQGNVVAATSYTLTPPATLNLNGFTRT